MHVALGSPTFYKLEHVELAYHFLREHFLHWLEALGLTGKMSEGVRMITKLQSMLVVSGVMLSHYDLRY